MTKFNKTTSRTAVFSPVKSESTPTGRTHEGAPGYARDTKSELFLLAVSNMVGEDTFYENAHSRDDRYTNLIHTVAVQDPEWTARFLQWLRSEANMRSASLVGALEAAKALLTAEIPGGRQIVASVLQRADEPGEALAYWTSKYGRAVPKSVKRGVADAAVRLYTEYALLKYDTDSKGWRFGDVIDIVHPTTTVPTQGDLFEYALDRRHKRDNPIPEDLTMIRVRATLMATKPEARRLLLDPVTLKEAGMTWEALAGWLQGPLDAEAWETVIPSMGYMALLRNLRNFDQAGVSDKVANEVMERLSDPGQVARSRQFPFRFLSAYENAPNLRWGHALDKALKAAVSNVPAMPGRNLILVDTSGSMTGFGYGSKSTVTPLKAAAVFGAALASKGEQVDLYGFASGVFRHDIPKGASVIREVDRLVNRAGEVGHGTDIAGSVRSTYKGQDRVFIISDMQTMTGDITRPIPKHIPVYGFNLGGYQHGAMATGSQNRHEFGGLTDAVFKMVPLLEAGKNADWPF